MKTHFHPFNKGRWSGIIICFLLLLNARYATAQSVEFPKGFSGYLSLQQGVVTSWDSRPDLYQIGMTIDPQYTLIPGKLRIGARGAALYAFNRWNPQAGPALTWKLKEFQVGALGSLANLQLTAAHLWGDRRQKLAGGEVALELGQFLKLSLGAYRNYGNNNWWIQSGMGYQLFKPKAIKADPFMP